MQDDFKAELWKSSQFDEKSRRMRMDGGNRLAETSKPAFERLEPNFSKYDRPIWCALQSLNSQPPGSQPELTHNITHKINNLRLLYHYLYKKGK